MSAIVGCLLGLDVIEGGGIAELCILSDGSLLAQNEGDIGFNNFIGTEADITQNWNRLLDTVEENGCDAPLTPELREEAEAIFQDNIQRT